MALFFIKIVWTLDSIMSLGQLHLDFLQGIFPLETFRGMNCRDVRGEYELKEAK